MRLTTTIRSLVVVAGMGLACASAHAVTPGTGVTYQGVLAQNGTPVDGLRDFRFRVYDADTGGTLMGTVEVFDVDVVDGAFSVELDFGIAAWADNIQRWVEIEAGPAGGSQMYELIGRQKLTAAPYSLNTRGLTVDASGNVGIGTTAPVSPLNVRGASSYPIRVSGPMNPGIRMGQDGAASSFAIYHDGTTDNLTFRDSTTAATRMVISGGNGNVGIGTTAPLSTLDISPQSGSASLRLLGAGQAKAIQLGVGSNGLAFGMTDANGSNFQYLGRWDVLGNLGVGTQTPQSRLDVRYTDGNGIEVTDTSTGSTSIGVQSTVGQGTGVRGESAATSGAHFGVYGQSASASGWGVYSNGRLGASGTKSFMIDHPLDPAGAYLLHYSSESPEPQNRYNGNVILDGRGAGVVMLPDYFGAINTDFRYTLTPIGAPAPNLYIAQEVHNNAFVIAGGQPGMKVSWEVIARRSDAFVVQRGAPVEVQKVGSERGKFLMPSLYGQAESRGIHYVNPAALEGNQ